MTSFVTPSADGFGPKNTVSVIQGSSKTYELEVKDENGEVVNLTGGRVIFTVKRDINDPLPLIQKDTKVVGQVELTQPKSGKARIYLVPADTASLDPRLYIFDVWVQLSTGKRFPVVPPSNFEVKPSVTVLR